MARYNEHKCLVCGQIFEYCRHCAVIPVVHKAEGFCSEKCSDIFNILSKHSCNLATIEETLAALKNYDTTNITEDMKNHIKTMQSEVQEIVEPELTSVKKETVVESIFNKKKW